MRRSLGDAIEASSSPRCLKREEDNDEEVAASSLEGSAILRFSSHTVFNKDKGCRCLQPSAKNSTKKKLSGRLTVRGQHHPKVLSLLLPLSLSSSFSFVASSSLAIARPFRERSRNTELQGIRGPNHRAPLFWVPTPPLVGEGEKGSAGGGARPRHGVRVVRRQPRVLVERQILPLRTSDSKLAHIPTTQNRKLKIKTTEDDERRPSISDHTAECARTRPADRRNRRSAARRRSPRRPSTPLPANNSIDRSWKR
ncbi:hypothetical protein BHM03_00051050 [Ensete ventricosum]|nr:hypothetical protein BHM03_00051050 [Ensete ventricosum]